MSPADEKSIGSPAGFPAEESWPKAIAREPIG
jgi:hypothetical protein